MKGIGLVIIGAATLLLAACGTDNTTTFVLSTASATSTVSPSASASASSATAPATGGASPSPASSSVPAAGATPIGNGLRVIIDSPDGSSAITSPVEVSGTASVRNGAVLVEVRDASGNVLGQATTTAGATAPNYGSYDVTVSYSGGTPGAKGEIRVMDAATQKNYYFITIRFG